MLSAGATRACTGDPAVCELIDDPERMREQGGQDAARRAADVLEALVVRLDRPSLKAGTITAKQNAVQPAPTRATIPPARYRRYLTAYQTPRPATVRPTSSPVSKRECRDDGKGPEPVLVEEPD